MRPVLLALLATGCISTIAPSGSTMPNRYQLYASGFMGCRAGDIAITEHVADSSGSASWVATCGARTFVCGGTPQGSVSCAPLVE